MTSSNTTINTQAPVFIVCEDVRQEVGGKVSFIGVYAGNCIGVSTERPPGTPEGAIPVVPSLSLVLLLMSDPGTFTCKVQVIGPDGTELPETSLGTVSIPSRQPHLIALRQQPFPISKGLGVYRIRFLVGSKTYEASFEFVAGSAPSTAV